MYIKLSRPRANPSALNMPVWSDRTFSYHNVTNTMDKMTILSSYSSDGISIQFTKTPKQLLVNTSSDCKTK